MPEKKRNNFRMHQQANIEANKRRIEEALAGMRRGTVFSDIRAVVEAVVERTDLHRTTITRNAVYFGAVLEFFARQPGTAGVVPPGKTDAAALQAKLLSEQIRTKRLELDNERLKRLVANVIGDTPPLSPPAADPLTTSSAPTMGLATAHIALTLLAVLQRLADKELGIELVPERQAIIDITEVGDREVVVGPGRVRWLLEWLDENRELMEIRGKEH
jgi:hypothetical protein